MAASSLIITFEDDNAAVVTIEGDFGLDASGQFNPYFDPALGPVAPRTDVIGVTNGSNVVTDASAIASDSGKLFTSAGFAAPCFVGVVTPGVSYTVVTVKGGSTAVNCTAGTGVSSAVVGSAEAAVLTYDPVVGIPTLSR